MSQPALRHGSADVISDRSSAALPVLGSLSLRGDLTGVGKNQPPEMSGDPDERNSDLLAATAHELRSPVSAIVLFSELLEGEGTSLLSATQRELISSIRSSSELVLKLIEDLLDVSASGGMSPLSYQRVDMAAMADECVKLSRVAADRKSIVLSVRKAAGLPCLRIDRLKILRVINELLNNAIRVSGPGRKIQLSLSVRARFLEVAVEDEGPGISADALKHLFVPFPKDSRARKPGERGLGLGLAMVKGIVAAHGGRVRVKSQRGVGSTFVVSLPIEIS